MADLGDTMLVEFWCVLAAYTPHWGDVLPSNYHR